MAIIGYGGEDDVKRVLVTGVTGFIGRAAAAALQNLGFEVHGTSRPSVGFTDTPSGITIHRFDLLDAEVFSRRIGSLGFTHLLLGAWVTSHGLYWTDPVNDRWVAATAALSRAFFSAGGRRIVLIGTCAEYDWSDPILRDGPVREDSAQGRPHQIYGQAKKRAAEATAEQAAVAGGTFADGRLFFPIGPRENSRRLLPTLITSLMAGRTVGLGSGDRVRDFIDVRDAGSAFAALIDSEVPGPVNIGTGTGTKIGELALQVSTMLGRRELIQLGAQPPNAHEPPILIADVTRLGSEAGFRAQYALQDTLSEAVAWWKTRALDRV